MQTENNYERKNIWFDRKKFKVVQSELAGKKSTGSATRVETLIELLDKYSSSKWIETDDQIRSFCFYFPEVLKTHLYNEKDKCWEKNPFNDNNFCNAMFNLLKTDKDNLSRNCVLLLEGICFPDIRSNKPNFSLFSGLFLISIDPFFTDKWNHIPKPSDKFMNFLIEHISADDIKNYHTKFINGKLRMQIDQNTCLQKCISVRAETSEIQTRNNFIISCLLLFLDKKFKYPSACKENILDFIDSAMNIYENMYKNFIGLPHDNKKDAIYDFFYKFSQNFIDCIYQDRENETAEIKRKADIHLINRFYSILKYDRENLNLILNELSSNIDSKQDFTVLCENDSGTSDVIEFHTSVKDNENKFSIKSKNNCKKEIWFDREKFESFRVKASTKNWFSSANDLETLTYCLENHNSLEWVKTFDDLKNFCFYFPEILKTHLYSEEDKCWLKNPLNDDKFRDLMSNLLNKDKKNLSRNCVLLLEGICFPSIRSTDSSFTLRSCQVCDSIELFFTNKLDHMPKPINKFMDFLITNISKSNVKKYCTKFINNSLRPKLKSEELSSRKWIFVQENDLDIQIQNNFVVSYLSLFLNKGFKYPSKCEKDGLDFIESAMNLYENMYKNLMGLPNDTKEDVAHNFFSDFSVHFIKDIIDAYREDKKASIKYKHGIYLFYRFYLMLKNDTEHLNQILEHLFMIINVKQDFILPYKNAYGTWNFIEFCGNVATNYVANKFSNEKSIGDLKDGKILNYEELLPDELIYKIKEYNNKSKSKLQFDIKQEIFLLKNGIFNCDISKFLENLEHLCKIFGLISDKDGKAKKIDDIHLEDLLKLLAENKFNLFKYVYKLESYYGAVAIRGIEFLISEFEKFIEYHSVKNETDKLFLAQNNDMFTENPLLPNKHVHYLYNLMITKFIKAQTESDELAEIVSILLKKFGSVYDLIYKVKDILAENSYGYKLESLWNFVLDCVLHVDKESNKSVLSLLIKLVNDNFKEYMEKNDLEQGEIALSFVRVAMLLIDVAKAFDYDTNIFCGGQKQKHKNNISNKTFDLLNKIIEDENFKSFFELDVTLHSDLKSIQACFEQMKNLKFEFLFYLTNEIFNPNVEHLEQFFPLLEKCADICNQNNEITIFNLIQQTKEFAQKKVSKVERIDKIKKVAKKIKNYAHEIKESNLENKNLFLDRIQTENEKESRKANDLLKKLLKQVKKVVGSIYVGERGSYLLHSDLLNQYFNSLYEIFCMVYDPKYHSNLNSEYKNTYREIISDSYNSTIVTKISGYTISAITDLNKKNIFEKIDEIENIDTEIIGSIIWLINVNINNQAFFKNENGENIISSVIDGLKQLQENLIDYKKKLRLFNTDQLLNELKNHKGQEISFANQLIKKAERKQERLLNNLEIRSGQFDAELYKKKKKAMKQLTDLNIYTIKLIASLCILKSNNNYVLNIVNTVNNFCKKLHDFLDTLYVLKDEKNLNSGCKGVCAEIISDQKQSEMVIEISKFTMDAIKFLNEKDIFEKVDLPKYEGDEDIDIKTIDSIVSLLSNTSLKDIVFFKNEKGEDITSNIIDDLKSFKEKILKYVTEKSNLQESNKNQIINDVKETKEEHQCQKITRSEKIDSGAKDKLVKLDGEGNKNNDKDDLQNNGGKIENTDINEENNVVEDNENISSQANNNTNKIQNVNNMNKDSNEKQIEENRQNVQRKMDLKANDTFSLLKNEFDKTEEVRKKAENKKYSLNMVQNKIKSLINNKDKNVGNDQRKNNTENVVFENKKDQNKINSITTNEKEINEKQIEVKKQNVENEIDNKFRLIKNAFNINDKEKDENNNKTTDRKHSFSASQDKIEFSLANESENLENKPNNNNIETDFFKNNLLNSEENKKSNSRTDDQKEFDEKQVSNEQNSILHEDDNKIKAQGSKDNNSSNLDINSDTNNNSFLAKDSSNINYRNQNENIERVSTNTLRGQKNNDKANANNSGVDTSKQNIQKNLADQSDHCAFFLKKWCIFFYQRKKISISITVFSAIFLAVGLLFAYCLAITAAVSLVIDLTIFLFGKCFSTGSCSKNITTNIDNINKNYEISAYNSELVPTLVLCENKKESDLFI